MDKKIIESQRKNRLLTAVVMRRLIKHYGGEWGTYGPPNSRAREKLGELLEVNPTWVFKIAQGTRTPGKYPWMLMCQLIKEIENDS
jgi:hypothetical protein